MSDGNKRYLGDVFIDAENMERQKQFFKDIIESYQWKFGGSFDASTLQGFGASDFATREQGDKADRALLGPINLGQQSIVSITDPQYIYTDAVKLDRTITNILESVDWFDELKGTENDDVTHALEILYRETLNNLDLKLDKTTYNNFIDNDYTPFKQTLSNAFEIFEDWDGSQKVLLNSDLSNGLRFILITQHDYNELPEEKKKFWRNVFIIKDPDDIPADYHSPLQFDLTDGYEFAINDGYLQVKNVYSSSWKNICSLTELLSGTNFDEIISNFLILHDDYLLDDTSLLNSLQTISTNLVNSNWESIPFLSSSLHDDFIESITINGSSDHVITSINNNTKFKLADLDINGILDNSLSPINTSINTLDEKIAQEKTRINNASEQIGNILNRISQIDSDNISRDSSLDEIRTNLNNINNNITSIEDSLENLSNGIGDWKSYIIPNLTDSDSHKTYNYYNETLGLAYIYINLSNYYKSIPKNTWRTPCKNKGGTVFPYTVVKARPAAPLIFQNVSHVFITSTYVDVFGRIRVQINQDFTNNTTLHHGGGALYRFDKIYTDDELTKIHNKLNSKKNSAGLYLIDGDYTRSAFENAYK